MPPCVNGDQLPGGAKRPRAIAETAALRQLQPKRLLVWRAWTPALYAGFVNTVMNDTGSPDATALSAALPVRQSMP